MTMVGHSMPSSRFGAVADCGACASSAMLRSMCAPHQLRKTCAGRHCTGGARHQRGEQTMDRCASG